jgi:hypothetical protein
MRVWIAAAMLTLALFDLEFSGFAARAESRANRSSSMDEQQLVMEGADGYPPR